MADHTVVPDDVRRAFDRSKEYFPTLLQEFQLYDKYARFDYKRGRRETWVETVNRATNYLRELSENKLSHEEYERIRQSILNMKATPSMRLLAMAGSAAKRQNIAIYNCSFMGVDSLEAWVEALIISMSGCGVGFSVEHQFVDKLPRVVPQNKNATLHTFHIPDSTEGWAESLRAGLIYWFNGEDVIFDYSEIRPEGAPLKTKGGRASGPKPLKDLHDFARQTILGAQGRKLTPLECHDIMCEVGSAAVCGGVRRTAMISLFDYDDDEMRNCKNGEDFPVRRWNANNSAVWPEGISDEDIRKQMTEMFDGMRGEPGIFNKDAANKLKPKRRKRLPEGTNPCGEINLLDGEFCVSYNTPLITKDGITKIGDAVGKEIDVWNGEKWSTVMPKLTRKDQKLYRVTFGDGSFLDCTPDHKFSVSTIHTRFQGKGFEQKTAQEIKETIHRRWATEPFTIRHDGGIPFEYAYELGVAVGDGHIDHKGNSEFVAVDLYGEKQNLPVRGSRGVEYLPSGYSVSKVRVRLPDEVSPDFVRKLKTSSNSFDEIFSWDRQSILLFVAGLLDTDGSQASGNGVRLYVSEYERAQKIQLLLTKCGIRSSVNLMSLKGQKTNYGFRKQDMWYLQIVDGVDIPTRRLSVVKMKSPVAKGKYQTIKSVEELQGAHDVFCFTENERHMGVFNNTLTYQCNLTIAIARADDTFESLRDKIEVATIIGTIQSMAVNFPGLRDKWKSNCEEERLLGVDINGQLDSALLVNDDGSIFEALRNHAVETNKIYAEKLGIPQSASVTCVKPSGNSSQLFNCSSGLHARWAPYYIRNVRVGTTSPLYPVLRDAGVPLTPENGQTAENATTWVASFPVKSPEGAIVRNGRGAIEQCEYWLKNKIYWTEHNPSVTITYTEDEKEALTDWVIAHKDLIGGMSFLPQSDAKYDNMPYVEITKEKYEEMMQTFPTDIDFSQIWLYEDKDLTEAAQLVACTSGNCDL